jgi:hypothetical protein
MKSVFDHIGSRAAVYAKHPMFAFLADTNIDPRQRLEFVPWLSHFVMTFADLYSLLAVENPDPGDRFQELVNIHLREESPHWKWFLADLDTLGLNPSLKFTDALRLLWGPETTQTRLLAYRVCQLTGGLSSLEKLVVVQAIEATGRVSLEALVPVGVKLGANSGKRLVYFGDRHLDTERQHTVEEHGTQEFLESIHVEERHRPRLCALVDEVFQAFGAFADEAFERATSTRTFALVVEGRQRRASAE